MLVGMYVFLDWFFLVFHGIFTLFNIVGWIPQQTRKIHLWTINLTIFSWAGLGLIYGWGYCFLTDWHYQVLYKLGESNLPRSYITYTLDRVFGLSLPDPFVLKATGVVFLLLILITYALWIFEKLKRAKSNLS